MQAADPRVHASQVSALTELDALQDEVLSRLDDLDRRLQQVLDQCLRSRPRLAPSESTTDSAGSAG
jgi:hypothetical protein